MYIAPQERGLIDSPSPTAQQVASRHFSSSNVALKQRLVILGSGWAGYELMRKVDRQAYGTSCGLVGQQNNGGQQEQRHGFSVSSYLKDECTDAFSLGLADVVMSESLLLFV